ncbi:MAG: hypothetical protein WC763_00445 [Candidatus Paceibacterota bacterium]|jgi:hypothetical protein
MNYLKTAHYTVCWSVVAFTGFIVFIALFLPRYYERNTPSLISKVWIPKEGIMLEPNQQNIEKDRLVLAVSLGEFKKRFSGKPVSLIVRKHDYAIDLFGETSDGILIKSSERIPPPKETARNTHVVELNVSRSGIVSFQLKPDGLLGHIILMGIFSAFVAMFMWVAQIVLGLHPYLATERQS